MSETETKEQGKKRKTSLLMILMIIIAAVLLVTFFLAPIIIVPSVPPRMICSTNLSRLGKAMLVYGGDNDDEFPTADKWCDLLLQYVDTEEYFVCPSGGEGRCHYAINANLEPYGPPGIVLLFETKGGWNQFGGPEILTFENHKGEGCNILFNDGHVNFVTPEELNELKWKVEKGESGKEGFFK